MKTIAYLMVGVVMSLMAAGSALAFPLTPETGFTWVDAPFWTNTDHTTGGTGNSGFSIFFEGPAYQPPSPLDGNFGLFAVDNLNTITQFQVFSASDEASFFGKSVDFRPNGSGYQVRLVTNTAGPWVDFSNIFGFYFQEVNVATNTIVNTFYSLPDLDTDGPDRNVRTAQNALASTVLIYLDHAPLSQAYQMTVYGNDLTPIPEPGTMLLLGTALLGLAIYGKRQQKVVI